MVIARKFFLWRRLLGASVAVGALLAASCPARASFDEQMAIDATAVALANNVTAAPPGLMSIHYNPAGLAKLGDGSFFSQGVSVPIVRNTTKFEADPNFRGFAGGFNQDPLAGMESTNTGVRMYLPFYGTLDFQVAPSVGISHRNADSPWTFAIGQYAPFGAGIVNDKNDATRFGGQSVYQQHLIYAAPAVSYRVNKTLSVGASVGLGQTAMGATLDMRSPNDLVAMTKVLGNATTGLEIPIISELTFPAPWFGGGVSPYDKLATAELRLRSDFSPSFNLGVLWEPNDWFSFGACYQSPIKVHMEGRYNITYSDAWQRMVNWFGSSPTLLIISGMLGLPNRAVPNQSGTVKMDTEFPQMVNLGITLRPFDRLKLFSDIHWANWSAVKEDKFVFDQDIQILQFVKVLGYSGGNRELVTARNFRDTWNWGVAAEYRLLDWLYLRGGYERRNSSNPPGYYDMLHPIPDLDSFGTGFGIKLKSGVDFDVGLGYMVGKIRIPDNGSVNLNSTEFTKPVYNPYAGLNYEQRMRIYIASVKATMPLHVMGEMLDSQMEMVKKVLKMLNPFG